MPKLSLLKDCSGSIQPIAGGIWGFIHIYLTHRWDPNKYYHSGSDLRAMAIKECSTLPRAPELEPHH